MQVSNSFDVEVVITLPLSRSKLDEQSKTTIKFRPDVTRKVDIHVQPSSSLKDLETQKPQSSLEQVRELKTGYETVVTKADGLLKIVSSRANKAQLNMPVDPKKDPILAGALWNLFKGNPLEVTFDMYTKLLEYDYDLSKELSKEFLPGSNVVT